MLPKAIDYFCQNANMGKHAFRLKGQEWELRTSMRTRRTIGDPTKIKLFQGQEEELWSRTHMIAHLLDLWSSHAPIQLQRPVIDWMQKEREIKLAERKEKSFKKDILNDRVSIVSLLQNRYSPPAPAPLHCGFWLLAMKVGGDAHCHYRQFPDRWYEKLSPPVLVTSQWQ
jgi:hypothetical protein